MATPKKMTIHAKAKATSPEARVRYHTQGVSIENVSVETVVVADGTVRSSGSSAVRISVPSYQASPSVSGFFGSVLKRVVSPISVSPSRSESRTRFLG